MVTKNISVKEIECNCNCGLKWVSNGTLLIVQMARDYFGEPVVITSGARCPSHNAKVGGSERSQHMPDSNGICHAIDFYVKGKTTKELYDYLDKMFPDSLGLGLADSFVHIDDRLTKRRWKY